MLLAMRLMLLPNVSTVKSKPLVSSRPLNINSMTSPFSALTGSWVKALSPMLNVYDPLDVVILASFPPENFVS